MDINSVNGNMNVPVVAAPGLPAAKMAEHRSIVQAVKATSETEMFGRDNLLMFQRDTETNRMVIQVINKKTHEVVSQIPAEYLLRLAEDLKPQLAEATPAKSG